MRDDEPDRAGDSDATGSTDPSYPKGEFSPLPRKQSYTENLRARGQSASAGAGTSGKAPTSLIRTCRLRPPGVSYSSRPRMIKATGTGN